MLCEKCKKNLATFHYTEIINGIKNEHHLCGECAAKTDVSYYTNAFDNDLNFTKLLSGIFGRQLDSKDTEDQDPAIQVQCPNCKMTYGEFIHNSSFGCPECYDVFGLLISDKIKRLQGSDTHVGKRPLAYRAEGAKTMKEIQEMHEEKDIKIEIEILDKRLRTAVKEEDFSEAAKCRDMIAELKGKEGSDD